MKPLDIFISNGALELAAGFRKSIPTTSDLTFHIDGDDIDPPMVEVEVVLVKLSRPDFERWETISPILKKSKASIVVIEATLDFQASPQYIPFVRKIVSTNDFRIMATTFDRVDFDGQPGHPWICVGRRHIDDATGEVGWTPPEAGIDFEHGLDFHEVIARSVLDIIRPDRDFHEVIARSVLDIIRPDR